MDCRAVAHGRLAGLSLAENVDLGGLRCFAVLNPGVRVAGLVAASLPTDFRAEMATWLPF